MSNHRPIPFFTCTMNKGLVKINVCDTIDSGFLSEGVKVAQFERKLSDWLGVGRDSVVAVNSGTSALHLALETLGVMPGHEVIVSPQTFVATALAVLYCGARPVFCDVNPVTGLMAPNSVRDKITPLTKAIMPVHWGGAGCDMAEIMRVAIDYNLVVIEDAAQAIGTQVDIAGDATCYSFQATKHLTTGDGGAVWFKSLADAKAARSLRWFGIDREASKPHFLGEREYELTQLGYKYHLNDVAASIGLATIDNLDYVLSHHRNLARAYKDNLPIPHGDGTLHSPPLSFNDNSWWFYPLIVERRDDFARAMNSRGVPCSVVHRRIDRHEGLFGPMTDLPGMDHFDAHQINLPIHTGMDTDDVEWICDEIKKGW